MKKFLIFISILLLICVGYFTYDHIVKDADLTPWSFVPNNAIMVYESDNLIPSIESIKKTEIWTNLSYIPEFRVIEDNIDVLDSIAGNGNFRKFFAQSPLLASLHVTSSKNFDLLYVIEISNISQQAFLSKAQAHFSKGQYQKKTRVYEGFTITEVIASPSETFTYIYYKNYIIGSFSSFLVEDAIRTVSNPELVGFEAQHSELYSLTKLQKDQGNLYLNYGRISSLFNTFTSKPLDLPFGRSGYMDLSITNQSISLSGFTFAHKENDFLRLFSSPPGSFDVAELIPNNTASFYHISSLDPISLGKGLATYLAKSTPEAAKLKAEILKDTDFDIDYVYHLIDEEIAVLNMESANLTNQDKMMILEISDMGEAIRYFNGIGERYMIQSGDSLFEEQYSDYAIRRLPVPEFPYALLGEIAKGFDDIYYLQFRNHLIFSNSLQQLKLFVLSIENESTWTKSLRTSKFLGSTNKESSFSLFINTQRSWGQLMDQLKPSWRDFSKEHQFSFRNMEFIAAQFSAVDDKFYTSITIHQPKLPKQSIPERINTLKSTSVAETIISKPWITTNPTDRSREVIVQDSAYNIYLIDTNFTVLWSKSVDGAINGKVWPIDYYKNGKIQYLFETKQQVHIFDRTGNYLPEFPKGISGNRKIEDLKLIDYNNTKDYRIAIADHENNVYLHDKNLKPLNGWNPKSFEKPLLEAPAHYRINGRDVILVAQQDGKLFLFNRKGDIKKGFPLDLKAEISEAPFISSRNTMEQSTITLITKNGEIIELNFNGGLIRREQLYKPGAFTNFSLLRDVSDAGYLIIRQTGNNYEILDPNGASLFEKSFLTKSPIHIQYYPMGGGAEFIVFVDSGGSYLYLYDKTGTLITGRPLAAEQPVALMQYENEFRLFVITGRNIELISFSL